MLFRSGLGLRSAERHHPVAYLASVLAFVNDLPSSIPLPLSRDDIIKILTDDLVPLLPPSSTVSRHSALNLFSQPSAWFGPLAADRKLQKAFSAALDQTDSEILHARLPASDRARLASASFKGSLHWLYPPAAALAHSREHNQIGRAHV